MAAYFWYATSFILYSLIQVTSGRIRIISVVNSTDEWEVYPEQLEMVLHTHEGPLSLRLKRNPNVNMDFVTYSAENGVITQDAPSTSNVALYTDQRNQASIAVTSVKHDSHKLYKRSLSGWFTMNGAEYTIEPEDDVNGDHTPKSKRFLGDDENHEDSRTVPHTITRREIKRIVNDHGAVPNDELLEDLVERIENEADDLRRKRAGKAAFGVELLLGVDYGLYKRWINRVGAAAVINAMKQYYALTVNGIDMRYASIQDPAYSVFVRLSGIIFSKSVNEVPWTDPIAEPAVNGDHKMVDASKALERIRTFDRNPPSALVQHDHFMVFTDHDIYTGNYEMDIAGLAYTRTTCTTSSQSIVEDYGGFTSIGVAAHELGHSLGAEDHDGEGFAEMCSGALQFIMTAVSGSVNKTTGQNPFVFSQCSIAQMKTYLVVENNGAKCLSADTRNTDDDEFQDLISTPPGQLYGPDDQCKQVYGPTSLYCGGSKFDQDICFILWCLEPNKQTCVGLPGAVQGTTCGDKKWCDTGLCVYDERAPSADASCVHGDYKAPFTNGKTCATLTSMEPKGFQCYTKSTNELCCASCKTYYNRPGCEYGDKVKGCTKAYCTTYKDLCCKTCQI